MAIIQKNGGRLLQLSLAVLLMACGLPVLRAETVFEEEPAFLPSAALPAAVLPTIIQGATRPLRSQPPASSPASGPGGGFPTPHFPLPTSYSLVTAESLNQPQTQRFVMFYSRPAGIRWLNAVIGNGSIYFPFIREEIARRNMPPEFIFLPFIESEYIPTARSRSGATGIWQFMMNSIGTMMRVNDTVDERRDFRKSTVAALVKLNENYQALGCWYLALAAYNAGLGGVRNAMQRANTDCYWTLSRSGQLRTETIEYVPKFLAVSYIMSKPRQFGVDWWAEPLEWTVVRPSRQASLDLLATETGTDRNLLFRLNAELIHGITPPDSNYELVVPLANAPIFDAILERDDILLLRYYRYQVKYGDTLSALSRHYDISINLIEQHNPGITNRFLRIGETIIIPAFRETGPYTGGAAASPPLTQVTAYAGRHVVVQGDTLWSLALRFGISPHALALANGMELSQILSIGKVLNVPIME